MKRILSNLKVGVLLPVAIVLATSCADNQEKITELTSEQISFDKSISRLKFMRDSTVQSELNKDDLARFGISKRQELDSLRHDNHKLFNSAYKNYVSRIYKNHKLKHYFKPDEIKQIITWFAEMGKDVPVKNITGDMPMFYLSYLNGLETDTTKTFSTPFVINSERGDIVFLDKKTVATLIELEQRVSDYDIHVAESNLRQETTKKYDAECKKIIDLKDALLWGLDNGQFESHREYTKANADIEKCEADLRKVFDKYYIKDAETSQYVLKSVAALSKKNKGASVYGFEYLNFTIPEFAAIRSQMTKNSVRIVKLMDANRRANSIKKGIVDHYDARIKYLTEKRDSVSELINKLNIKTY